DRKVVVIGGGDSASEEAIQLAAYASEVTLLVRGDHMRASQAMQAKLQEYAHIHIIYNVKVQEIMGNGEYVTGIDIIREGKQEVMATDGVFLAIGHKPNSELVKNSINCDAQGYIVVEGLTQKTSQPGVFAAGDVADHRYRQAGVAAGDGIKAALDAERFLREDISVSSLRYDNGSHYFVPENRNGGNSLELIETIQDLEKKIGKNMITIVDVYAPYCPDCMAFLPTVEKVAERYIGKVAFVKVDLSKLPELSKKYEVYSIPCLLLFKEGNLISKINEVLPLRDLIDITDKLIA
ncbi:MAG TPA: FAD-dependent oxidoreductase, partial [Candidatus Babeliaceae bacterium]|nr:FAD-dependent oxidoreductase [Candidatus Babeliaceae bacterium]